MAFVRFEHRVKYNGKFYDAGEKIKAEESDMPSLREIGAEEIDGRTGKNRKQSLDIDEM